MALGGSWGPPAMLPTRAPRSPCRMLCCGLLMLVLSWASMAVDTAAAVVSGAGGEGRAVPRAVGTSDAPLSPQGTSDFCVAPDKFIVNQTDNEISAGESCLGGGGEHRQDPKTHLEVWFPPTTPCAPGCSC